MWHVDARRVCSCVGVICSVCYCITSPTMNVFVAWRCMKVSLMCRCHPFGCWWCRPGTFSANHRRKIAQMPLSEYKLMHACLCARSFRSLRFACVFLCLVCVARAYACLVCVCACIIIGNIKVVFTAYLPSTVLWFGRG